jgi:2-methylcitrate dehydratase PrpD
MRMVEQLAAFVTWSSYNDLSVAARQALKIHVLDALGCAISPGSAERNQGAGEVKAV